MTAKSGNQGMRQPQLGGILSQSQYAGTTGMLCRHTRRWRPNAQSKWICAVCHPPAVAGVEFEETVGAQ